jgi:hypothetical protein
MLATMHPHEAADNGEFFTRDGDRDSEHHVGFGEDSRPEATVGPDWDGIESALGECSEIVEHRFDSQYATYLKLLKFGEALTRWLTIDATKTSEDGKIIRLQILKWVFLPEYQNRSLTYMAREIGKEKQSVGRWHDNFKLRFPGVHAK